MDEVSATADSGRPSAESQPTEEPRARLSHLLSELKKDSRNPDLWMEAAKVCLTRGDHEGAIRCARACLKASPGRRLRRDARGLIKRAEGQLQAEEPREESLGHEEEGPGAELNGPLEAPPQATEDDAPSLKHLLSEPEWAGLKPESEEETLEQLRRELSPKTRAICPNCNTIVGVERRWCYGCGREMRAEVEALEERVRKARAKLQVNAEDGDALFTLGAYFAVRGQHQEALEALNKLGARYQQYSGLWWLKARVFQLMGKDKAASAAKKMAIQSGTRLREEVLGSSAG